MNLQEIQLLIAIVKDVITTIATITAAVVAVLGLQAWKKQLKGKNEYELAQRLLRSIYMVRNAFSIVRAPFSSDEVSKAKSDLKVDNNQQVEAADIDEIIYKVRVQELEIALIDCDSVALEAEALWGKSVGNALEPVYACVVKLYQNIQKHLKILKNPERYFGSDIEDDVYEVIGESRDNSFSVEIKEAIKEVENFLKPRLKL